MSNGTDTPKDDKEVEVENPMAILEDALVVCKFGRFHVKLMATTLLSVLASTAVTTCTSYVLPNAECDLNLTMMQKGLANAIPFLGQLCAALFTGFIIDAFGRKMFLAAGNLCLFACGVLGASSQNYWMLLVAKLAEGVVMSLTFTATASMVTEFTHKNVRDRVLLLYSSFMSISVMLLALLAWGILPLPLHFVVINGYFELHSWNLYLYLSSCFSLLAAIMYWQLPESPKFLFSHGHEDEALDVLKGIYKTNTGQAKETFPVTSLNATGVHTPTLKTSLKKQIVNALFDAKDLYRQPHLFRLILMSTLTFVCLFAYSALRLWYPQLSTIIENYKSNHNTDTVEFCVIMNDYNTRQVLNTTGAMMEEPECVPVLSGSETYTNGVILGLVSLCCISVTGYLVDHFGQKPLMFVFFLLCAACSGAMYWSNSSLQIALLVAAACGFMQTAFSLQHNILVRVFPTTVRTLTLSLVLMMGRVGSLIGNIMFPWMLQEGCMVPFITLSSVTLAVAAMVYFLPNPNKENSGTGDK